MNDFDKKLIKGFLTVNYAAFQEFLEANGIDGTEAELLLEELGSEQETGEDL